MEEAVAVNPAAPIVFLLALSVLFLQLAGLDLEDTEFLTYLIGFCIGIAIGWGHPI